MFYYTYDKFSVLIKTLNCSRCRTILSISPTPGTFILIVHPTPLILCRKLITKFRSDEDFFNIPGKLLKVCFYTLPRWWFVEIIISINITNNTRRWRISLVSRMADIYRPLYNMSEIIVWLCLHEDYYD